ncbi:hypothetical protein C8R45DRAFT_524476 [Mycena sanguinolenta]|nr:hypothetical protein C8R45DRAFT_524476 [Mycena sanguinolenta]
MAGLGTSLIADGYLADSGASRSFQSGDAINNTFYTSLDISPYWHTWLSQANHIFHRLNIRSNFEDYVAVNCIYFYLNVRQSTENPPPAFLFLCPKEDFRTGPSSFGWPPCMGYWSLDLFGVDRLSPEEATRLGLPPFNLCIQAFGSSWDATVYEGLRQFHEAKGFDPYSQDVARHLHLPLYQVSVQIEAPFTEMNSDDEDFDADIDSDCNSTDTEDYESEYPLTSACGDSDVDTEFVHIQEIFHEPVSRDGGSEHTVTANCESHDIFKSAVDEDMFAEEMSQWFVCLENVSRFAVVQ